MNKVYLANQYFISQLGLSIWSERKLQIDGALIRYEIKRSLSQFDWHMILKSFGS